MKAIIRVGVEGRTTVPVNILKALKLKPGDLIDVDIKKHK